PCAQVVHADPPRSFHKSVPAPGIHVDHAAVTREQLGGGDKLVIVLDARRRRLTRAGLRSLDPPTQADAFSLLRRHSYRSFRRRRRHPPPPVSVARSRRRSTSRRTSVSSATSFSDTSRRTDATASAWRATRSVCSAIACRAIVIASRSDSTRFATVVLRRWA